MPDTKPRSHKLLKTFLPVLVLFVGFGAYRYMVAHPPTLEKQALVAHYPSVEVLTVNSRPTSVSVNSQGTVRPRSETVLKPEVAGRVIWMSPQLVNGGIFSKGEKLLDIDPTDYRTALASSKTALARAEIEFGHAKREYRRIQSLRKRSLASETQIDQAQRSFKLAEAALNEARIQREQAKTNLDRTTLHAPFDGRVRRESVDLGQYLSRGENIATLYATDYYEVHLPIGIEQFIYLDIPPTTQGVLPPDRTLPVTITGKVGDLEFNWEGQLERTEGEIDAATRLLYGVVTVANVVDPNRAPLLVGMFVKASIEGRTFEDIVTLPRGALRDNEQVLVVDSKDRLHFRDVDILRIQGNEVLVKGGLADGERVCISPLTVAVEGMRVISSPAGGA